MRLSFVGAALIGLAAVLPGCVAPYGPLPEPFQLARVDPRTRARVGQEIELQVDIDRLHVFETATQRAIGKIELPGELLEPRPALPDGDAAAP